MATDSWRSRDLQEKIRSIPPVKLFIPDEDIQQMKADLEMILRSGMLTLSKYGHRFEQEWAAFVGVKNSIAVNSGTSALEIALRCVGVEGGEVIVPTNTFGATAAAAIFAGGRPVLCDIDAETLCMSANTLEAKITERTRAVIVVHIGGLIPQDILEIRTTCQSRGITLIEDAAHAHGSQCQGTNAGAIGDVGCFSFYPTKVMTTGEGGMITTNSDEITVKSRVLRDQGKESYLSNRIVELGNNWRMPELSAALGLIQLKHLPWVIKERNRVAKTYNEVFQRTEKVKPILPPPGSISNYYKYVALLPRGADRERMRTELKAKGISLTGEVYSLPLHLHPAFSKFATTDDLKVSEDVCGRMICPPIYPQLTDEEAEFVAREVVLTVS